MQRKLEPQELFDSVVTSFESGDSQFAFTRFLGVLDAVAASGTDLRVWRAQLLSHRLGEILGCKKSQNSASKLEIHASRAEVPIAALLSKLALKQALLTRQKIAANAIQRALKQHKSVLALDAASYAAAHSVSANGNNFTTLEQTTGLAHLNQMVPHFDLIVALQWVSRSSPETLPTRLSKAASVMAPKGQLLLSSFLTCHVGSGWRLLCADDEPFTQSEASLSAAAADAGLIVSSFREAQNTLLWAVAQRKECSIEGRGKDCE